MPKSSVKNSNHNHHHHSHNNSHNHHQLQNHNSSHNSNLISLDNSQQQCNNGINNNTTPHLQNKDASKRLKMKLRLQEMRCNLMSTKMTELKTALSTKKRQLRVSEKRAKEEEKKRRDEEKKLKEMEKEFHRLRRENDQMNENLARNQIVKSTSSIATATTPTLSQPPQQQKQSQASTSNPSLNNNSSSSLHQPLTTHSAPLTGSSTVTINGNKNKNNKQKRIVNSTADDPPQVSKSSVNHVSIPMIIDSNNNGNAKQTDTVTPSKPSSSKDLRINEGASCSGVNSSTPNSTDASKILNNVINNNDGNHFFGTSKLEDLFENELMCPICHELYIKPVALSCSHIFCSFCIEQWRKKAHRCPICRNMILDRSPQNVLENVIDKVVSTMDEDSRKRRSDVIKDRPVSSESNRFSRNEGKCF